jgi:heme-degrading monooxygenase HmoA
MPYALVRITFEDFEKWKAVFDEAASLRQSYGSKGVRVSRNLDQPNEVVTVGDYEDLKRARQLFQSPEFWAATQRAGVIGRPEVSFLEEVERLPA